MVVPPTLKVMFWFGLLFNPLSDFIWVVLQTTSAVKSIVLFWFGDFGLEVSLSPKVLVYLGYFGLRDILFTKSIVLFGIFWLRNIRSFLPLSSLAHEMLRTHGMRSRYICSRIP
jgi:hypothetical protein